MESIIQVIHKWSANIMIIIFMHSTIIWFLFSQDKEKINNNFFNLLLRLELISSFLILITGIGVVIKEPAWLDGNQVIVKIILALIAIGIIQISTIKTKHYINNESTAKDRKLINILRAFAILFLMTVYTFGTMINSWAKYGKDPLNSNPLEQLKKNEN